MEGRAPRAPLPRGDVLVVDNYDSFTHNAVHALAVQGARVVVVRNDEVTVEAVLAADYPGIVLSPGPGRPDRAGITLALIRALPASTALLGICLGHQALGAALGGRVVAARRPLHGTPTPIHHGGMGLLQGLPSPFPAARYHSLVLDREAPGENLEVTATSEEGDVMAVRHRRRPWEGVQFHPESYLTPVGAHIFAAFVDRVRRASPAVPGSRVESTA